MPRTNYCRDPAKDAMDSLKDLIFGYRRKHQIRQAPGSSGVYPAVHGQRIQESS